MLGHCEICGCELFPNNSPIGIGGAVLLRCNRCMIPRNVSFPVTYNSVNNLNLEYLINKSEVTQPLECRRQDGKKPVGPAILMEIFGYQLQIGKEKGYSDGSWKDYLTNGEDLEPSISRHTIGRQEDKENDGWYTEYHPVTKEPLPTKANHAYARFWNAAVDAMRVFYKEKKKNEKV